jgi:hypothetical protein
MEPLAPATIRAAIAALTRRKAAKDTRYVACFPLKDGGGLARRCYVISKEKRRDLTGIQGGSLERGPTVAVVPRSQHFLVPMFETDRRVCIPHAHTRGHPQKTGPVELLRGNGLDLSTIKTELPACNEPLPNEPLTNEHMHELCTPSSAFVARAQAAPLWLAPKPQGLMSGTHHRTLHLMQH